MKSNSYAVSLLLLVLFVSFEGTVGMAAELNIVDNSSTDGNITDPYDLNNISKISTGHQPAIQYPIFGYTNHTYNFSVTCNPDIFNNTENVKVVFYWDTWRDTGKNSRTEIDLDKKNLENGLFQLNCTHKWSGDDTYGFQAAVFEGDNLKNLSYWMPIDIKPEFKPNKPHELFMEKGNSNKTYYYGNKSYYCGYEGQFYTFVTNATDPENEKIWYYFYWDEGEKDSTEIDDPEKPQSYSHSWDISAPGNSASWHSRNFTIKTEAVKRDVYSKSSINSTPNNTSILIIKDPGDFVPIPIIGSFRNWGIFLITIGSMVLFFARNSSDVPAEISVPFIRRCYLKSRNTFIGIFLFCLGMYLYFVFRRAPWDIPIVNRITSLENAYFGLLSSEADNLIPYLSLVLALVFTIGISTVTYFAYTSGYGNKEADEKTEKRKAKNEKMEDENFSLKRGPSPVSSQGNNVIKTGEKPPGTKPGIEELITLIENEKNPLILKQLYFVKFRYLGDSPEEAASRVGVTGDTGSLWEDIWYKDGYEGLRALSAGKTELKPEFTSSHGIKSNEKQDVATDTMQI